MVKNPLVSQSIRKNNSSPVRFKSDPTAEGLANESEKIFAACRDFVQPKRVSSVVSLLVARLAEARMNTCPPQPQSGPHPFGAGRILNSGFSQQTDRYFQNSWGCYQATRSRISQIRRLMKYYIESGDFP